MDYTIIPLTRGLQAIISPEDADLKQYTWHARHARYAYPVRFSYDHGILLHRVVMERMLGRPMTDSEEVDHVDGDALNNRRGNLRLATHAQNMRNRKLHTNNQSGHAGVYFHAQKQQWRATIRVDRKEHHLGYFHSLDKAVAARQQAEQEYFGTWARTV